MQDATMEPQHDRSLVPRPSHELTLPLAGRNRILGEMLANSVVLARSETAHLAVRLPIPWTVERVESSPPEFDEWGDMQLKPRGFAGFIDEQGNVVVPLIWDAAQPFREGLSCVRRGGKWGFIDDQGKVVISPQWDAADSFREGLACVRRGDAWCFIDRAGNMVIQQPKSGVHLTDTSFSCGLARIRQGSKTGYMDRNGNIVIQPVWDSASKFSQGLARVSKRDQKGVFIDQSGEVAIATIWDSAGSFCEGLAPVQHGTKWGFINQSGESVIASSWIDAHGFSEGLAVVGEGRSVKEAKYGFVNKVGDVIIPPCWDVADSFSEGLAYVQKDGEVRMFIEKNGERAIALEPDMFAYGFFGGFVCVQRETRWGLIGRNGKIAVPLLWNSVESERIGDDGPVYRQLIREMPNGRALCVYLNPNLEEIWKKELPIIDKEASSLDIPFLTRRG